MAKLDQLLNDIFDGDVNSINESEEFSNIDSWDSMKHVFLITGLQDTFDIELSAEEIGNIRCIKDIKKVLDFRGVNG